VSFSYFRGCKILHARICIRIERTNQRWQVGSGFLISCIKILLLTFVWTPIILSSCFLLKAIHHEALGRIDFEVLRNRTTFSKIRVIVSRQRCTFRLIVAENRRDTLIIANLMHIAVTLKWHADSTANIRTVNQVNLRHIWFDFVLDILLLLFSLPASYVDVDGDDEIWSGW